MKDLKFGIIAILVILLIFFATLQIRITMMEDGFQDKYLSLIVAVDLTRDRVKELAKRQSWSDVSKLVTQVGLLRCDVSDVLERQAWDNKQWNKFIEEDILFIEMQLQDIRDNQFIIWKNNKEENAEILKWTKMMRKGE